MCRHTPYGVARVLDCDGVRNMERKYHRVPNHPEGKGWFIERQSGDTANCLGGSRSAGGDTTDE